jgi:ABC-type glycerol-3-phosphate transport system substrate-binding protein
MKRDTALRTMAAALSLTCLLSAASCSLPGQGSGSGSKGEKPKQSASEVLKHTYTAEPIGSTPDVQYVNTITRLGDTDNVLITGSSDKDDGEELFITDLSFDSFTPIIPKYEKGKNSELYCNTSAALDGTIFHVANITDHGDMEMPDWSSPDFDFDSYDWDAYNKNSVQTTYLYTFDSTGKELSSSKVNMDIFNEDADDEAIIPYLSSITPIDSTKALAHISAEVESYYILNTDGTFGEQIDFPDDVWLGAVCATPDKNIAFTSYYEENQCIGIVDTKTFKVNSKAATISGLDNDSITNLVSGDENYAYYASSYRGLYGIKDNGTAEMLTAWVDSDLSGDNIRGIMPIGNNEFIIYIYDYSDASANGFYRIKERDASELQDKTLITVAVIYSDSDFMSEVNSFNRTSDKYRIKINDYSKYYDWDQQSEKYLNTPAKQFKLDIIAGNSPDMVYFSDPTAIKGLSNKGVFVDLNDYLGKDGTVSKDDIVPSLLKACEEDGKLYSISPNFGMTTVAVKKALCDKENWTIDDLIETYEKLPEGAQLTEWDSTKINVFNFLMTNMNFVDYKNGKCSYDSDEFIKILEFANRFPDEEEQPDWENMNEEQMDKYYEERQTAIRKNKALISQLSLYDLRDINRAKAVTFGEDITLAGYPSRNGCGMSANTSASFAILSDSPNKDECWRFISSFFTSDYQKKNNWSLPALKSVLEDKLDEAMKDPNYTDENGEKHYEPSEYTVGDQTITIPNLSAEDREYLKDLIYNANVSGMSVWDSDIEDIVNEEINAYFAGEKTAKQTAEIIQNRVSIMVSEQS